MALAIYRAAPAMQQYQKDLEGIASDPAIVDATWDLVIAAALRLAMKGRNAVGERQIAEMKEAAPQTFDFLVQLGRICSGFLPGGPQIPQLEAVPPDEPEAA